MTNEELAKSIRVIRESNFLTQQEFADILGVNKQAVWYWEKGLKRPTLEHLKKIDEFRVLALQKQIDYANKQSELLKLEKKVKRQKRESLR